MGVGKTGPKTTRAPWKQQWHWWAQGDENFEYVALLFWPYLGQRRKARVEELRAQRTAYLAHRYRPRPCRECGEEFRPQTHAGIERAYCTVACSIKYHNNQRARAQCA